MTYIAALHARLNFRWIFKEFDLKSNMKGFFEHFLALSEADSHSRGKKRIDLDKGRIDLDQAGVNQVDLEHWKIDYSISWNLRILPYCYTFFFKKEPV
ncbi:hypothetical protein P5673_020006 [Acropora cervicornis]|uniref:Uncharacterized protein n=1 Tax=Acropora cervicornis TaxID=6130 RepID=A0AAD9QAB0_ACRCE|nr:hypothetical protein P5673_020006 [Acropora cervicornis]